MIRVLCGDWLSFQRKLLQVFIVRNVGIDGPSNGSGTFLSVSSPPILICFFLGHGVLR